MEQNKYTGVQEVLHKIKQNGLHISRIPEKTKAKFISIANEEFSGDYGMLIKYLIDGLVEPDFQIVYKRLEDIESNMIELDKRISNNENVQPAKEDNKIKLLNGKEIKNGRN